MLRTRRLTLRDMTTEDEEALSAYQSNPTYLAHYSEKPDTSSIIASAIAWAKEEPRSNFQFAVVLQSSGAVIGCAGLRQRDYPTGEAELGVEINPAYWRRGFAKEALNELLKFGKSRLAISTFWAEAAASNTPAQSLFDRLGFTRGEEMDQKMLLKLTIGE
jgi:ribosomal-protein-alanine N-acetyltransferase